MTAPTVTRAALTADGWWVTTDPDGTVHMGHRDDVMGDYEDVDYAWQCAAELAEVRDIRAVPRVCGGVMSRVVAWFSHGAPSAVATKLALRAHGDRVVIASIDTGTEHEDNPRFLADCERWYGQSITLLHPKDYADTWDVFERTRYLVGPSGARCTIELKKRVRHSFERSDDLHVFGYTVDPSDAKRAQRFVEQNPGVETSFPLIERGLTKADCLALVERAGIELPAMYRLGYRNNNCIGCVKGGMGYWNKIREDFPAVFDRMQGVESQLGRTVLRDGGQPLPLIQLSPGRGNYEAETPASCDLNCQIVEIDIEDGAA